MHNIRSAYSIFIFIAVHGFLQSEYSIEEGEVLKTTFQLDVKGVSQLNGSIDISGIITAEAATNTTTGYN